MLKYLASTIVALFVVLGRPQPAIAQATDPVEDLFLVPSREPAARDEAYLRALCEHITASPTLTRRYRHIFIGGSSGRDLAAVLGDLKSLRLSLASDDTSEALRILRTLEASHEDLNNENRSSPHFCKHGKDFAQRPISVVFTQWLSLGPHGDGLFFRAFHAGAEPLKPGIPGDRDMRSGFVPVNGTSFDSTVRALGRAALLQRDEDRIAAEIQVDVPSDGRCKRSEEHPCMLQTHKLRVRPVLSDAPLVASADVEQPSLRTWHVTSEDGRDLSNLVVASIDEGDLQLEFRRSGIYKLVTTFNVAHRVVGDHPETRTIVVQVEPRGLLLSEHGGPLNRTYYMNASDGLFPFMKRAPSSAIADDLKKAIVVPGEDIAKITTEIATTTANKLREVNPKAPSSVLASIERTVGEAEVRYLFQMALGGNISPTATLLVMTTLQSGNVMFTRGQLTSLEALLLPAGVRAAGWCSLMARRIHASLSKSDAAIFGEDTPAWLDSCKDATMKYDNQFFEKNPRGVKSVHIEREKNEYLLTIFPWLEQRTDIPPDSFVPRTVTDPTTALVLPGDDEVLRVSARDKTDQGTSTMEQRLRVSAYREPTLTASAFAGVDHAAGGKFVGTGGVQISIAALYGLASPMFRFTEPIDSSALDTRFAGGLVFAPWCYLSAASPRDGFLNTTCRHVRTALNLAISWGGVIKIAPELGGTLDWFPVSFPLGIGIGASHAWGVGGPDIASVHGQISLGYL